VARVTIEDCLTKVENRFALVIVASKRAKALCRDFSVCTLPQRNKEVVMALREIGAGTICAVDREKR
jgi:DNA-directed RNA polymerase subunit omega